jgi:hypothetical protein
MGESYAAFYREQKGRRSVNQRNGETHRLHHGTIDGGRFHGRVKGEERNGRLEFYNAERILFKAPLMPKRTVGVGVTRRVPGCRFRAGERVAAGCTRASRLVRDWRLDVRAGRGRPKSRGWRRARLGGLAAVAAGHALGRGTWTRSCVMPAPAV